MLLKWAEEVPCLKVQCGVVLCSGRGSVCGASCLVVDLSVSDPCSHRSGRHSGGDLRAGEADHRGAVGFLHLGPVQGEVMRIRSSHPPLFWKVHLQTAASPLLTSPVLLTPHHWLTGLVWSAHRKYDDITLQFLMFKGGAEGVSTEAARRNVQIRFYFGGFLVGFFPFLCLVR